MFSSQPENVKRKKRKDIKSWYETLSFRDFQGFDIRLKDYQVIFSWKKITWKLTWNLNDTFMAK